MKINGFSNIIPLFNNSVREKREGQGGAGQNAYEQQQKKREPETPVTDEAVDSAVTAFHEDSQMQANGLSVSVSGKGHGLKVVLKDGSGTVVRQFTGEEFLKLREAVSKDSPARGKLLDRKL